MGCEGSTGHIAEETVASQKNNNEKEVHGEGNGNPLQYSCLENPMDRGAWWAIVHGVPKGSDTT